MMYNRSTKSKYQKIKIFKIFKFSPQGVPIGTPGSAKSLIFYSFANITKINRKCDVRNRIFSIPGVPMAQKWSFNGRPKCPQNRPESAPLTRRRAPNDPKTLRNLVLSTPDELEDNLMRVLKLRSSSTTSEQQRSTIRSHRTSVFNFCVPRRRHPRQVEPYLTVIWKTVQGESGPFLENASHLWSAYFLSTPDELRDDWRRVWKLRSRLITSRRHPACILYNFSPENAIPKTSATSSKVPPRLPLSKIRVAHGRPNFCFRSWLEISHFWSLF